MHGYAWQHKVMHGSAWLVHLLEMELGNTWLVGQGSRTLQQWGETSKCPLQPMDAGNRPGCTLHLLEKGGNGHKSSVGPISKPRSNFDTHGKAPFQEGL